ncbi:MAG: hypothetical protein VX294_01115 [Candidatus Latescibacterota bacterium]|nr:hypothetical protein [Candidatus Latescibacterota bacterium]
MKSETTLLFDRCHEQVEKFSTWSDLECICDQIDIGFMVGEICDLELGLLCEYISSQANQIKDPIEISFGPWVTTGLVCDCCGSSDFYTQFSREVCSICHPKPNSSRTVRRYAA